VGFVGVLRPGACSLSDAHRARKFSHGAPPTGGGSVDKTSLKKHVERPNPRRRRGGTKSMATRLKRQTVLDRRQKHCADGTQAPDMGAVTAFRTRATSARRWRFCRPCPPPETCACCAIDACGDRDRHHHSEGVKRRTEFSDARKEGSGERAESGRGNQSARRQATISIPRGLTSGLPRSRKAQNLIDIYQRESRGRADRPSSITRS